MDIALLRGNSEIIKLFILNGGRCYEVRKGANERQEFINEQNQARLDAFLAKHLISLWPAATKLQKALDLPECITDFLTMPHPDEREMMYWFESGILPCSFSNQPLWEPILTQLEDIDQRLTRQRDDMLLIERQKAIQGARSTTQEMEKLRDQRVAVIDEQMPIADPKNASTNKQEGGEAFQVQILKQEMEKFRSQLSTCEAKQKAHFKMEKTLLKELQQVEIDTFLPFVRSAAQMEKELVSQLEVQLSKDRKRLLALSGAVGPKLG